MGTNSTNTLNLFLQNPQVAGFWERTSIFAHIAIVLVIAFLVHLLAQIIQRVSEWFINKAHARKNPLGFVAQRPKFITLTRLIASSVTFLIYFVAIGAVLYVGFPNFSGVFTTYLSSAAVIGLALSFGLQGLVQDVVTGVTLIFSDAMDVGDVVDLGGGVIGRVEQIGLRFTKLVNFYNQEIFVPNRNILNVSRFPGGCLFAYVDIQVPAQVEANKISKFVGEISHGMFAQFGAIILTEPVIGRVETARPGGWNFIRVQFSLWPGQGTLIENTFRQQVSTAMKTFDPTYADWMVTVTYRAIDIPAEQTAS